ncbi:MAG: hypothetical protein WC878_07915 [Candidatus Paceibacterota bacterium]|jgi:uncharacterized protein YegL
MPRLLTDDTMETGKIGGLQKFTFSATRTDHLGATEYTLVTIAVDETGSTTGFEDELRGALIAAVKKCQDPKNPRRNNLLLRVIKFSSSLANGYEEIHGFKPIMEIDTALYPQLRPSGMTPLSDAGFSSVGATNQYAEKLTADDYGVNGIVFLITDGGDNDSTTTPKMIKDEVEKAVKGEHIESLVTILVGVNASQYKSELEAFQKAAGINMYCETCDLDKLGVFVSQSISSQSLALGTGGPSQNIPATI